MLNYDGTHLNNFSSKKYYSSIRGTVIQAVKGLFDFLLTLTPSHQCKLVKKRTLQWAEFSGQDISTRQTCDVASFVHLSTHIGVKVVDFYMSHNIVSNVNICCWDHKGVI